MSPVGASSSSEFMKKKYAYVYRSSLMGYVDALSSSVVRGVVVGLVVTFRPVIGLVCWQALVAECARTAVARDLIWSDSLS